MKNLLPLFRLFLIIVFAVSFQFIEAQKISYPDNWNKKGFTLTQQNRSGVTVNYSISEFTFEDAVIEGEAMQDILLPGNFLPNNEGAPNLPGSGRYIAIPEGSVAILEVVNMRTERFTNIEVAPAPRIPWDTDTEPLVYEKDQSIYTKNAYYPEAPVRLSEISQIRGVDVVILGVTPFQYNPVTKELIVYRDLEIQVHFEGGNGQFGEERLRSRFWDPILNDALLNYQALPKIDYARKAVQNKRYDGCEYLIIVPDGPEYTLWAEEIREFRIKQGITTEIVTLTEIGGNNVALIEAYINNAYNNWDPAPAGCLLMADYGTDQTNNILAPIYDNYCASDNIYADVSGDHMPDVIMARMTANNADQLEVFVTKFIDYESNPPTSSNFYNNPITALGFQTSRWFQICSESIAGFFEVVHGKNPVRINDVYTGNPATDPWSTATNTTTVVNVFGPNGLGYIPATPGQVNCTWNGTGADITNAINSGGFLVQHRDHGGETGWSHPPYSNSDIDNLVNPDLTFVFSINCLTGKYNWSSECFAEKFHRHTHNGANAGALGIIAASEVSYSFVNDTYVWGSYDNMWPEFMPQYGTTPESRGILPSFGNAAGKYFLQQSSWPSNPERKELTYHLFHHHGDAFLQLYSEVPQNLTIIHGGVILAYLDQFIITADEGSVICFTVGDQIIGMATGTGVPEVIYITPQPAGTWVTLTVTKQNYLRHEEAIQVIPADGPYCIYGGHVIHDDSGNGNGLPDYNETIILDFTLKNVGLDDGENIEVTINTTDPYIIFLDDYEFYGTVPADTSITIDSAFTFFITDAIPDQHRVLFNCVATDSSETWESIFLITVNAPNLHINDMVIDDSQNGNGNGQLDPGEEVEMTINYTNSGHATAYDVDVYLEGQSGFVEILNPNQNFASIGFFGLFEKTFTVVVDDDAPEGIVVDFVNELTMNEFFMDKTYPEKISAKCEDFETGDFTQYPWQFDGNEPWQITNQYPYAGWFSAMSGEINDGQSSQLNVSYEVMTTDSISFIRKVSSEAGDVLQFFIDNTLMGDWSGTTTGWTKESFPVTYGTHTFKWIYVKNGSGSTGADCAWLDNIVFPPPYTLTIWAGPDEEVCAGDIFIINEAYGTAYATAEWTSSGTGTFANNTIINTSYDASDDDIANGEVTLTLSLWDDESNMIQDDMVLGFAFPPDAPPTPEGPDYVDLLVTVTSDYTTLGIEDVNEYAWYLEPEDAGTIEGTRLTGTVTWDPDYLGTAYVSVSGINECGEGDVSDSFEVTVDNTVGIRESLDYLSLVVAPNPSTGIFYLDIVAASGTVNFKIINLLGLTVYQESIQLDGQLRKVIDLGNSPNGIYFLVIEDHHSQLTRKIIKK